MHICAAILKFWHHPLTFPSFITVGPAAYVQLCPDPRLLKYKQMALTFRIFLVFRLEITFNLKQLFLALLNLTYLCRYWKNLPQFWKRMKSFYFERVIFKLHCHWRHPPGRCSENRSESGRSRSGAPYSRPPTFLLAERFGFSQRRAHFVSGQLGRPTCADRRPNDWRPS